MRRGHECTYDDSSKKSRTQILREKLHTLEAKVRELECVPGPSNSAAICDPSLIIKALDDPKNSHLFTSPPTMDSSNPLGWDVTSLDPLLSTMFPSLPFDVTLTDTHFDFSSTSSPSPSELSLPSHPNTTPPTFHNALSSEPAGYGPAGRSSQSEVNLSAEMQHALMQSFLNHRKQCCFYPNPFRVDQVTASMVYPHATCNSTLTSVIYLLGSFYAKDSIPGGLEKSLLEQALHEVSTALHNNQEQQDVFIVSALCLLAQYFFFKNRFMEGNRHLFAAKRMAVDLGLHKIFHPHLSTDPFDLEFNLDHNSQDWIERSAVFWQIFMVDKFWSAYGNCNDASPVFDLLGRHITTPLPTMEHVQLELTASNCPIHKLFDSESFHGSYWSTTAFKIMASCIFDRAIRMSDFDAQDGSTWVYHHSAEVALERISSMVQPFVGRQHDHPDQPHFDTDLYLVHNLILSSTIHLHLDNVMNPQVSWAAKRLVELVNQLTDQDYQYLDPTLAVCWSSIIKAFRRVIANASSSDNSGSGSPASLYAVAFLRHCTQTLLSALHTMGGHISLADHLACELFDVDTPEPAFLPHYHSPPPCFSKTAYHDVNYPHSLTHVAMEHDLRIASR
ncbi:hypothetical protein CVT24_008063 [Panaeolus cyanescens]|uniref:Xylanolytic transcriptional activator regulatory domain-containing protein n=1 Tax=Panaeolus cyanescens TaxID=181874 RepID=A0A409W559_9AGAR|nr:hypothetical protein CVT24_008063 [Panaeolus cyanescens]